MVRFIKVVLPIDKPEATLKLCKKASDKHIALGAGSPLNGFLDMVDFEAKRASAATLQTNGDTSSDDSQALYGQAKKLCGITQGQNKQTEGTLYWYVLQIRDVLLIKNRMEEENLSQWGFNVVVSQTGGRRNVRVDIPDKTPEPLATLAAAINAKHVALGVASPLNGTGLDMTAFGTKADAAVLLVQNWEDARADMQAFHGQARTLLGYSEGQTSETEGTLYYDLITIRDRLLQVNQDEEENLSQWGFEVVVTGHSTGGGGGSGGGGGLTTVVVDANASVGINEVAIPAFTPTPSSTMQFEADSELLVSAAPAPGPVLGPNVWHAFPPMQNKTWEAYAALIGLSITNTFVKIQNNNAGTVHFKITFNNVMVAAASS